MTDPFLTTAARRYVVRMTSALPLLQSAWIAGHFYIGVATVRRNRGHFWRLPRQRHRDCPRSIRFWSR
jgi:hypothetical protein